MKNRPSVPKSGIYGQVFSLYDKKEGETARRTVPCAPKKQPEVDFYRKKV